MTYNEKIVKLRKANGYSQQTFANLVGVSRQAVYKWEAGQSYPEAEKLIEIKKIFGIKIDDLLDDGYELVVEKKVTKKKSEKKAEKPAEEIAVTQEVEAPAEQKPVVQEIEEIAIADVAETQHSPEAAAEEKKEEKVTEHHEQKAPPQQAQKAAPQKKGGFMGLMNGLFGRRK